MKNFKILNIAFTIALLFCIIPDALAQTAKYTYKPMAAEGCIMEYSIAKQGEKYYIIAAVESDRLSFLNESSFWIKTFDDDTIKLKGNLVDDKTRTFSSGNITLTRIHSSAQFEISEAELKLLNKGVAKVKLSTTPIEHKRTFKKDKIGKKLYKFYLQQKKDDEEF